MLYEEFLRGTKAREGANTCEQYKNLENICRDCEDVTKEDIYKIWKQTYGKQEKLGRERRLTEIQELTGYRDPKSGRLSPKQEYTRRMFLCRCKNIFATNVYPHFYGSRRAGISTLGFPM